MIQAPVSDRRLLLSLRNASKPPGFSQWDSNGFSRAAVARTGAERPPRLVRGHITFAIRVT